MKSMRTVALVLALVMLAACGGSTPSAGGNTGTAKSGGDKKPVTIAYLTPGLDIPFWKFLSDGIHQAADKAGAKVVDYDSRNSANTQLKNAQDAITKGVSAIIISPTDSASCPAVLKAAKDANVPVIIADIGTDSGDYVSFIISTNEGGAKEAGEAMAKKMKEKGWDTAPVGLITISLARINGQNRTKGFRAGIGSGHPESGLLESKNYTRAEAQKFAQDLLTAHPDMRGLFTEHDEAALGAIKAIETAGKQKDLIVVSFDGSPETVDAIKKGTLAAASMQQPVLMGRKSMEAALDFLSGKTPQKETLVPTLLVTPENLSQVEAQLADTVFPKQ